MAEHESTPATSTAAKRRHPSQPKSGVEKKGQRPVRQSKRANIPGTQAGNVASIAKSG